MYFSHDAALWAQFPELAAAVLAVDGVDLMTDDPPALDRFVKAGLDKLGGGAPSELPEIAAWRRTFGRMGLKPTQYRCASEALLRRLAKEGDLPRLHPLVDLCNAVSMSRALPVAVFDLDQIEGDLRVRPAVGDEEYETFGGDQENPAADEIIFADAAYRAHARRWTNRQAATSAMRPTTRRALIVIEGLHETAATDVLATARDIEGALPPAVTVVVEPRLLSSSQPAVAVEPV